MKKLTFALIFTVAVLVAVCIPNRASAGRPNPPTIAGTVPVMIFSVPPGGTNAVPVPPRVSVIDERGRIVADVETTLQGTNGQFEIGLKKAGTYVVVGYYPAPNQITTRPRLADVAKKQTVFVTLEWPPQ